MSAKANVCQDCGEIPHWEILSLGGAELCVTLCGCGLDIEYDPRSTLSDHDGTCPICQHFGEELEALTVTHSHVVSPQVSEAQPMS